MQTAQMSGDNKDMLVKDIVENEYSMNFFHFTADDTFEGVKDRIIPAAIAASTDRLKKCLMKHCEGYEDKIETACGELIRVSESSSVGAMVPLKNLMDLHFKIPNQVLLDQDLIQRVQYGEEDVKRMDLELIQLENRIARACYMESFLEEEISMKTKFDETVDSKQLEAIASVNEDFEGNCSVDSSVISKVSKLSKYISSADDVKNKLLASSAFQQAGLLAAGDKYYSEVFNKNK